MTTEAAAQVAANIPAAIPSGAAPFTDRARVAAGLPAAATEAPPATAPAPVTTAAQDANAALAAANKIKAKREAQVRAQADERAAREAAERRATDAERRAQDAEARAARIDKDTLAVVREKGLTADVLAQAAIQDGTPEARIAKLEAALAERDQRDATRQQTAQQAETQRALEEGRRRYVTEGAAKVDDKPVFPLLARAIARNPRAVVAQAEAIAEQYREIKGHYPPPVELHKYQEWLYSEGGSETTKTETPVAPPPPATTPPPAASKSRSTRALAAKSAIPASVPTPLGKMTPKERRDYLAAQFKLTGKPA